MISTAPAPDLPVLDDPAVPADDVLGAGATAVLESVLAPVGGHGLVPTR